MNVSDKLVDREIFSKNHKSYYKTKNRLLSVAYYGLNSIASDNSSSARYRLRSLKDKVHYRILHTNAEIRALKTVEIFERFLIQPMRNMPSLTTYNLRDLSGTEHIYKEIINQFRKMICISSGEEVYAIAKVIANERPEDGFIVLVLGNICEKHLQKEWFEKEELETLKEILDRHPEEKESLAESIIADLFPSRCEFKDPYDGVCAAVAPYLAAEYFKGKSLDHLSKVFSKGVNCEVRDMFSVYEFLCSSDVKRLLLKHHNRYDYCPIYTLFCSYCGVKLEPIKYFLLDNPERQLPEDFEQKVEQLENIKTIEDLNLSQLEDGIYDVSILWFGKMGHMLFLHKESNTISIMDPNFGYLRAQANQAMLMITKLLTCYEEELPGIDAIKVQRYSSS